MVSRAVASRPTHPILSNILFTCGEQADEVMLSGFDQSLCIQSRMTCQIHEAGAITIPASILEGLVSRLPESEIELSVNNTQVSLHARCEGQVFGPYTIQALLPHDFPQLPALTVNMKTSLIKDTFLQGLAGVLFAASTDEVKPILTGVHMQISGKTVEFAATNGHRLAVVTTECATATKEGDAVEPVRATIPARSLREVERLLNKCEADAVEFRLDNCTSDFQIFQADRLQVRLVTRLLDGVYPPYSKLIPTAFTTTVTLERVPLLTALERLLILTGQRSVIKLSLQPNNNFVRLSTCMGELGQGQEDVPAVIDGHPLEVGLNAKYVIDTSKAMSSEFIKIELNSPSSPVVFSPIQGINAVHLIMPIEIREFT
jgi:DNA polymerase-3 subunit beta